MNNLEIRIGTMPGKLVSVVAEKGTTARELFELAEISVNENCEIRLDGDVINIDDCVQDGRLLVSMRKIKGNRK